MSFMPDDDKPAINNAVTPLECVRAALLRIEAVLIACTVDKQARTQLNHAVHELRRAETAIVTGRAFA